MKKKIASLGVLIDASRHFFIYLGPKKGLTLSLSALLFSILSILNIVVFLPAISFLTKKDATFSKFDFIGNFFGDISNNPNFYLYICGFVLFVFLFKFLFSLYFSFISGGYTEDYMNSLRRKLLDTVTKKKSERNDVDQNEVVHSLLLISKIGSLNWAFLNFVIKGLLSLLSLLVIFKIEKAGVLVLLLFAIIWGIFLTPLFSSTRRFSDKYLKSLKTLNHFILEEIAGLELFQVFKKTKPRLSLLAEKSEQLKLNNELTSLLRMATTSSQELVMAVGLSIAIIASPTLKIEADVLISIGYLIVKLAGSINEAVNFYSNSLENVPAFLELRSLNIITPEIVKNTQPNNSNDSQIINTNYDPAKFYIEIQNFTPAQLAIMPIDTKIRIGEKIKITGKNGIGKSSFLKSLIGLNDFSGSLNICGQNIPPFKINCISQFKISYATQDPVVFQGTILENLFATSDEIDEITSLEKKLNLKIEDLIPNWQSQKINENGTNLSGGQKQIISIFRALLNEHQILILDEFTNHLSLKYRKLFEEYFNKHYSDKIIIFITHDSSFNLINQRELLIEESLPH